MKKIIVILLLLIPAVKGIAQTDQSLREYFSRNINTLDPIEGIYEVEWYCRYVTPFVDRYYGTYNATFYIAKYEKDGAFYVYLSTGYGKDNYQYKIASNIKISKIGETNVYNFYYFSSKCRIRLIENNTQFIAKLLLDNQSARKLIPWMNIAPSVEIYPVYDCIKTYPTQSMYNR
ncbi:MAG: hypothetical protein J5661_07810 [Bacteroidaceae bacterium]|nr:hypothetical protein [Bacteroidaceae bacterium]